ncbi:MAG TPA: hypothetical protein VEC16_02075 [Alphaproteobacteria bacterium]|nr:hypothetical protein [Alphaproteobacteria bacterium]
MEVDSKKFYKVLDEFFGELAEEKFSSEFRTSLKKMENWINYYINSTNSKKDQNLTKVILLQQKINSLLKSQKADDTILIELSIPIDALHKSLKNSAKDKGLFGGLFAKPALRKATLATGIIAGSILGGPSVNKAMAQDSPNQIKTEIQHNGFSIIKLQGYDGKTHSAELKAGEYSEGNAFEYSVDGNHKKIIIPKGIKLKIEIFKDGACFVDVYKEGRVKLKGEFDEKNGDLSLATEYLGKYLESISNK